MNGSWKEAEKHLSLSLGESICFTGKEPLSGGCINQSWKVSGSNKRSYFVKTNSPNLLDMFIAESAGLDEILNSHSIRSPKSICHGSTPDFSYLILEYIPLSSLSNPKEAGKQLAKMHQTYSDKFGWWRDNTIGSTPQSNRQHNDWVAFWKNERLLFQLNIALKKGYSKNAYEKGLTLAEKIPLFFNHSLKPSLLHGDLWGGNCASTHNGEPVVFDPAIYYGDRETDIAMTELFGGFGEDFYAAYNNIYRLDPGYQTRKKLYNLYHILNHFNLFGAGYATQAIKMTEQLLAEV